MFEFLSRLHASYEPMNGVGSQVEEMLLISREMLVLVTEPLFSEADLAAVRDDLYAMDRQVNSLEQDIRRQVYERLTRKHDRHFSFLLTLFSVVKDAERCGDYAKNAYEVCAQAKKLAEDEHCALLQDLRNQVAEMLTQTGSIFRQGESNGAREFLERAHAVAQSCDREVTSILSKSQSPTSAAGVLLFRFFKRIVCHLMNIVSSVVMPLDKLDFFDETRREPNHAAKSEAPSAAGL